MYESVAVQYLQLLGYGHQSSYDLSCRITVTS